MYIPPTLMTNTISPIETAEGNHSSNHSQYDEYV
jgi:hypothetical protein